MSSEQIRAVIFDMGGTLEDLYYDDDIRLRATPGIQAILACHGLDARLEVARLYDTITAGLKAYQNWRETSEVELPSARVWSEFVFRDRGLPAGKLAEISEKLAFFYDTNFYVRTMRPEVPAMLARLKSAGFRLGVISNVVSLGQVPHNLRAYGLDHYFEVVVTSSGFGYRKPKSAHLFGGHSPAQPAAGRLRLRGRHDLPRCGGRAASRLCVVHPDQVLPHVQVRQRMRRGGARRGRSYSGRGGGRRDLAQQRDPTGDRGRRGFQSGARRSGAAAGPGVSRLIGIV